MTETINDIVRKVAAEMLNTSMQEITAERIHGWATRLGEVVVAKMETTTPTAKDSLAIGNAAKMREALLKIRKVMDEMSKSIFQGWIEDSLVDIMGEAQRAISSALSAPPRNCDLYKSEPEAYQAYLTAMKNATKKTYVYFEPWLFAEAKGETMSSKAREALNQLLGLIDNEILVFSNELDPSEVSNAQYQIDKADEALAEPLRNCDVGTAEEQAIRFDAYCDIHRSCVSCPLTGQQCALAWAQLPYETVKTNKTKTNKGE